MEKIIQLDKQLLVFLNSLGSEQYDSFWLFITKQFNLTPFFVIVLFLVYKKLANWKQFLLVIILIALLITVTDQFTELIKNIVQRLRPCNDPEIKDIIRVVKSSDTFSFFSGHAANSMATSVFVFFLIRRYYKYAFLLFMFPLIFAYSRIYLGLHFPIDILTGYTVGTILGFTFYRIYLIILRNYFYKEDFNF